MTTSDTAAGGTALYRYTIDAADAGDGNRTVRMADGYLSADTAYDALAVVADQHNLGGELSIDRDTDTASLLMRNRGRTVNLSLRITPRDAERCGV